MLSSLFSIYASLWVGHCFVRQDNHIALNISCSNNTRVLYIFSTRARDCLLGVCLFTRLAYHGSTISLVSHVVHRVLSCAVWVTCHRSKPAIYSLHSLANRRITLKAFWEQGHIPNIRWVCSTQTCALHNNNKAREFLMACVVFCYPGVLGQGHDVLNTTVLGTENHFFYT